MKPASTAINTAATAAETAAEEALLARLVQPEHPPPPELPVVPNRPEDPESPSLDREASELLAWGEEDPLAAGIIKRIDRQVCRRPSETNPRHQHAKPLTSSACF